MRLVSGERASRAAAGSVWTSEPARFQYSNADITWNSFGAVPLALARSSRPAVSPVSGSRSGRSVNGNTSVG